MHRAAHASLDLRGVEVKLRKGAAEGVAMHAEFFSGFALVSFVLCEDLKQITALELADRLIVGDSRAMHLHDDSVEFALHEGFLAEAEVEVVVQTTMSHCAVWTAV